MVAVSLLYIRFFLECISPRGIRKNALAQDTNSGRHLLVLTTPPHGLGKAS